MRLTNSLFAILAASALCLTACGGGGDDGDDTGGDDDPSVTPDASMPAETPDAMPTSMGGFFESCTPDAADPMGQGSCDAGYVCLSLKGSTGPYCTKTCTPGMDAQSNISQCDPELNGPGVGYCLLGVDFDGDNMPDANFCGVICNDLGAGVCQDCNDSCPGGYLQCTAPLAGQPGGAPVAEACQ